ncbi:MAG: PKD domain-containing protein [Candidatus Thermoplasmatota archaeon]|nr:PKD domain-containing protein [Candidatus Thermoplasmatota archaeon]
MVVVILILAIFAGTILYYETKEPTGFGASEGGTFVKAFADENIGTAPLAVNFSSLVLNVEGTPEYHWDFGDGETSDEINPVHNYTEEGNYTCKLTITSDKGKNVTSAVNVVILANKPPTVVVLVSQVESNRPHILLLDYFPDRLIYLLVKILDSSNSSLVNLNGWINCEGQVYDPEGDEIVSYTWELTQPPVRFLGKTQYPKFIFKGNDLANITFPLLYTYRWMGYSIKLTATDSAGNTGSDIKTFGVSWSDTALRRNQLITKWNNFWNVKFYSLPTSLQGMLTTTMWSVLGRVQTSTNTIVDKILSPFPESIKNIILPVYKSVWETQEKKYRKPNSAPNEPENPLPADEAIGVNLGTDLRWNCSDPDGHRLSYDVYFGTTSPPPLVNSGYVNTTFALGNLEPTTTYYWKIVAKDSAPTGDTKVTSSPIWMFTTGTV